MDDEHDDYVEKHAALYRAVQLQISGHTTLIVMHVLVDSLIAALIVNSDDIANAHKTLTNLNAVMRKAIEVNWDTVKAAGVNQPGGQIGRA